MTGKDLIRAKIEEKFFLALALFIVLYATPLYAYDVPLPVKSLHTDGEFIRIGSNSKLVLPEILTLKYNASIHEVRDTFSKYPPTTDPVTIDLNILKSLNNLPENVHRILNEHQDAYWINITNNSIHISVSGEAGALNALSFLEVFVGKNKGLIPAGEVLDWPSLGFRGVLITPGPGVDASRIKSAISYARKSRMNAIVLYINNRIALNTLRNQAKSDVISLTELKDIVTYASESGLEVIPLMNLLTRQSHGGLMLRAERLGVVHRMYNVDTYDPNDSNNYKLVFRVLDEIIGEIHPRKIHIGHEEVLGSYPKHRKILADKGERMLPADLFLKDVITLHDFLEKRNIETWMWGDMLISQQEFPEMRKVGVNGNLPGYGKPLRKKMPKDLVVCDWHYKDKQQDFPSAKTFADEGFRVIGTTWDTPSTTLNFTRYMSTKVGSNGMGMLAGIWGFWKQSPEESYDLITTSGNMFWNGE